MKKGIIVTLLLALATGLFFFSKFGAQDASVNKIVTTSPTEQREQAFQTSQATSKDDSVGSIEQDLNNTIIQDEDFSELE